MIRIKNENMILYFHKRLKYPLMVIEIFKNAPYDSGIKRVNIGEPFGQDPRIPSIYQHTKEEYIACSRKGYSYGHNAPAFLHKDSISNYKSTYLFSNISPQEIVFNSGLWLLFEGVSERILKKYKNGIIINGSIPGKYRKFPLSEGSSKSSSIMNIPSHMYKIIFYKKEGKTYYLLLIAENRSYYMDEYISKYKNKNYSLRSYTMSLEAFQHMYQIPFLSKYNGSLLLRSDGDSLHHPETLRLFRSDEDFIFADKNRIQQMKNATLYGKIIYSKSRRELETVVPNEERLSDFHKIYYQYKSESLRKDPDHQKLNHYFNESMSNPIM